MALISHRAQRLQKEHGHSSKRQKCQQQLNQVAYCLAEKRIASSLMHRGMTLELSLAINRRKRQCERRRDDGASDRAPHRSVATASVICAECEPGEDDEVEFKQYEIEDTSQICTRVCCRNKVDLTEEEIKRSYLGPTGHLERMSVWTRAAAVVYWIYVMVRPLTPMGQQESLSSQLAVVSYISFIFTFVSSVVYHVYSANRFWSAVTRLLDYTGIYAGIACGTLSDLSAVSLNLLDVRWQSVMDCFLAALIASAFFIFRRTRLSIDTTRLPILKEKCSLGFGRPSMSTWSTAPYAQSWALRWRSNGSS